MTFTQAQVYLCVTRPWGLLNSGRHSFSSFSGLSAVLQFVRPLPCMSHTLTNVFRMCSRGWHNLYDADVSDVLSPPLIHCLVCLHLPPTSLPSLVQTSFDCAILLSYSFLDSLALKILFFAPDLCVMFIERLISANMNTLCTVLYTLVQQHSVKLKE